MSFDDYEQMPITELKKLDQQGIPIPGGIKSMRGVTSDPYAEQGRRDLITQLKSLDSRSREKRQDRIAMITLLAAIASLFVGIASILI